MTAALTKDQRTALVASLRAMPAAMRDKPQWLVWSYVQKGPGKKPAKMPYYANGQLRGWPHGKPKSGEATEQQPQVEQGHELDRSHLVAFEDAIAELERSPRWSGVGFAFLPGDGLIGVDIDGAISDDGEISGLAQSVMRLCPGYTELSVSGRGMHIILAGELAEKFKSDAIGLEVYAGSQFFTCTGQRWGDCTDEPQQADDDALDLLRAKCAKANEAVKQRKAAERAAQQPPAATPAAPAHAVRSEGEKGNDFPLVNARALEHLSAWVPELFPAAQEHGTVHGRGYRVSSKALGRNLQEDLALTPGGIQDFGEEVGMSAVDVVMKWGGKSAHEALQWLASRVGVNIERRVSSTRRPEPDPEGAPPPRKRKSDEPPLAPPEDAAPGTGGEEGEGAAPKKKRTKINWENFDLLMEGFTYQYGSDVAWDRSRREAIKIANLRNTFGSDTVRFWLNHADRQMIFAEDVVFEPGQEVADHQLNLFSGLELAPEKGDPGPMLELLNYLCGSSRAPGMEGGEIAEWVLRWCALPLQRVGAKLDTALVFHGAHGTGKNLFFDCIRDLYGSYGVMVGQTEIEEKYNTWLSGKLLIIGDEVVSRQEMQHTKNRLKWIITQKSKIPIRAMNQDTRWESNHANLVFLSNESVPLVVEPGDRRFMVVYTPRPHPGDLYQRVSEYLDNGGSAQFLHFLLNLDLGEFDEHTKPPMTSAKSTLIELGYRPAERFMHEWAKGYLDLPKHPCTTEQLYRCFQRWCLHSGERFPPRRSDFTDQAHRFVTERVERDEENKPLPPSWVIKEVQMPTPEKGVGKRQFARLWIPRGCGWRGADNPDDENDVPGFATLGAWARWCAEGFDKHVYAFLRGAHQQHDGDSE
ncbi:MAG: hypothetical protein EOP37_03295 [Rubrivivax sp.]|nr:MAG: hypothetical protein EOP37_03295 [Rubrivivax sp.]